jgi:hypothetical protein
MAKIEPISTAELKTIMPKAIFLVWEAVIEKIDNLYDMDKEWDTGGKAAKYCLRFRRSGKTLVTLFPKEDSIGLMVVYGKDERVKFESKYAEFSGKVVAEYESSQTYRDGKWIMFFLPDDSVMMDLPALLAVKHKPNRHKQ